MTLLDRQQGGGEDPSLPPPPFDMVSLTALWLPILVSAVLVFLVSSVVHMVLPHHKSDMSPLPDEEAVGAALRSKPLPPGEYVLPYCADMKEMGSPEFVARMERGPVAMLSVFPNGPWNMGKNLGQWFVYCIVVSVFVAYLAGLALPAGAESMRVFRFTATVALLGHGFSSVSNSIWKGVSWGTSFKFFLDGLAYALAAAGAFAWLWPAA